MSVTCRNMPSTGGSGGLGCLQRPGAFVRGFLLAPEHHRHPALGIELDDHVRAFVRGPDVVLLVDPHRVRERPGVQVVADLANVFAVGDRTPEAARRPRRKRARWCCRARKRRCAPSNSPPRRTTSPRYMSGGSFRKSGTDRYPIGGGCCAKTETLSKNNGTSIARFIVASPDRARPRPVELV